MGARQPRKKAQLKKKSGVPQINEQMLFHGTSSEFVEAICIHNFDWRINGIHGALFGKGTYFARDAAYSSRFCKDDIKHGNTFQIHGVSLQNRHLFRTYKSMFLARVLIGDYINGDSKYMRPPSKDGSYVNLYDSCVDDTWNPKIFVVFDANQIYPDALPGLQVTVLPAPPCLQPAPPSLATGTPFVLIPKPDNSVPPNASSSSMFLVPFELLSQCWSSEQADMDLSLGKLFHEIYDKSLGRTTGPRVKFLPTHMHLKIA
ncbi:hypothetical protein QTO34_017216 [Cnephaeus nilssonii]|uniref:Poly [ADP-ribose] polymerase n=1 Tax=Cnephaeus nilssonii TaxID=3371016 RepID=A0AA40I0L1_CNENI|nr:hypothetical protein QTO34_017216 [Eptesicus nilssonii]